MDDAAPSADLQQLLGRALASVADAEQGIGAMLPAQRRPRTNGLPISTDSLRRWTTRSPVVAGPDQARRVCKDLDGLHDALEALATMVPDPELAATLDRSCGWSDRVWRTNRNVPSVHDEVRSAGAILNRYRVNAVLGRPLFANRSR